MDTKNSYNRVYAILFKLFLECLKIKLYSVRVRSTGKVHRVVGFEVIFSVDGYFQLKESDKSDVSVKRDKIDRPVSLLPRKSCIRYFVARNDSRGSL